MSCNCRWNRIKAQNKIQRQCPSQRVLLTQKIGISLSISLKLMWNNLIKVDKNKKMFRNNSLWNKTMICSVMRSIKALIKCGWVNKKIRIYKKHMMSIDLFWRPSNNYQKKRIVFKVVKNQDWRNVKWKKYLLLMSDIEEKDFAI